jgi:peptidoglycan lytic transglycosylase D
MLVRAKSLPHDVVPTLILALAVLGPGAAVVCSEEPLVDQPAPSPPAPPEAASSVQPPPDSLGSRPDPGVLAPLAPPPRPAPFGWAERPARPETLSEGGADLRSRVRRFPDYPVVDNDRVQYFVERFTGDRRTVVGRWFSRSSLYREMVLRVFRDHGLPDDLTFTAMIESGFDPGAVSRVGAKGLWQFMAPTARLYGLRVDRWVDERLDPEKSTVAAAAYLGDLYTQFGSWFLAQAAYNAGEVKVTRAIRLSRTTDFWELARGRHLRRETKDFVPSILAITLIGHDPDRWGFGAPARAPTEFMAVQVPPATDLRRLARRVGLAPAALRTLNPELWRGVTPPGTYYTVKVPRSVGDAVALVVVLDSPGRPVHVVRRDETLGQIARSYGVSVTDIVRWNRLSDLDRIRPGDRIRVASAPASRRAEVDQGGFR